MGKIDLAEAKLVFENPPENFHPKMEVVGCFIRVGDHCLFLKQHPDDSEANSWGIPGGKIGKTESALNGTIREVYEETDIDLRDNLPRFLGKVYIRYPEVDFLYSMFEVFLENTPTIIIDPKEHTEYRWMTFEEALSLPLIRGEAECIHLVYSTLFSG